MTQLNSHQHQQRSDRPHLDRHIVVVGMMAAGKTTFGLALAKRLGTPYLDSDDAISARYGRSGRELTVSRGVEWLHDLEADILRDHLASPTPSVISAAASTVDLPRCVQMLDEQTYVCWIDVPVSTIAERSAMGDHRRPMELDELRHRWERRIPIFESVADYRIDGTLPLVEQVETTAVAIEQTGRVP